MRWPSGVSVLSFVFAIGFFPFSVFPFNRTTSRKFHTLIVTIRRPVMFCVELDNERFHYQKWRPSKTDCRSGPSVHLYLSESAREVWLAHLARCVERCNTNAFGAEVDWQYRCADVGSEIKLYQAIMLTRKSSGGVLRCADESCVVSANHSDPRPNLDILFVGIDGGRQPRNPPSWWLPLGLRGPEGPLMPRSRHPRPASSGSSFRVSQTLEVDFSIRGWASVS
ncbi:uncharacterized protein B0H64DRAFT_139316 [Chaetomium fimeti]|uniref:Uncharacterized protein n=1 Tax=Chaetomium fimeti TaxID=1854472 RepID=A0AAE0HEY4_9PEZI|nr:hypothetical protein B0H64DRAFT_139316 [Chaetomium fimeti]